MNDLQNVIQDNVYDVLQYVHDKQIPDFVQYLKENRPDDAEKIDENSVHAILDSIGVAFLFGQARIVVTS